MPKSEEDKKQLFVRPNYDLRLLIRDAIKLSPDPLVRRKDRGWFPRLVLAALTCYVADLLSKKEAAK